MTNFGQAIKYNYDKLNVLIHMLEELLKLGREYHREGQHSAITSHRVRPSQASRAASSQAPIQVSQAASSQTKSSQPSRLT